MGETVEIAAGAGLGALLGWVSIRRQFPSAVPFCLLLALGSATFASVLYGIDDGTEPLVVIWPVVVATSLLGTALALQAATLSQGVAWGMASVAAGTTGALCGADRVGPALLLAVVAAGGLTLRVNGPRRL